jgi:cell division protein FtsI (penicillin-binding protein 3)
VCRDSGATAFKLFKGTFYPVAGKTGTALVANGSHGYSDGIYQSSFAGYFPADNPQYTCVVVIKNKPHAPIFYGALVAGPVFKEIADRLVMLNTPSQDNLKFATTKSDDSTDYNYAGFENDIKSILSTINVRYRDSAKTGLAKMNKEQNQPVLTSMSVNTPADRPGNKYMPALNGLGLKDALYICENAGLVVKISGAGRVIDQSIAAGSPIAKGQLINLELKITE